MNDLGHLQSDTSNVSNLFNPAAVDDPSAVTIPEDVLLFRVEPKLVEKVQRVLGDVRLSVSSHDYSFLCVR